MVIINRKLEKENNNNEPKVVFTQTHTRVHKTESLDHNTLDLRWKKPNKKKITGCSAVLYVQR